MDIKDPDKFAAKVIEAEEQGKSAYRKRVDEIAEELATANPATTE